MSKPKEVPQYTFLKYQLKPWYKMKTCNLNWLEINDIHPVIFIIVILLLLKQVERKIHFVLQRRTLKKEIKFSRETLRGRKWEIKEQEKKK